MATTATKAVPSALSDLLDKAFRLSSQQPLTTATASQRPDEAKTGDDVAAALVSALSNIARLTLATSGKDGAGFGAGRSARARTRALALECLGLGVQHLFDGNVGDGVWDDVLGVAAAGASDDRWGVRVAAAKVAGAVVKKGGGQRLLELLSSKQVREYFSYYLSLCTCRIIGLWMCCVVVFGGLRRGGPRNEAWRHHCGYCLSIFLLHLSAFSAGHSSCACIIWHCSLIDCLELEVPNYRPRAVALRAS